MFLGVLGEEGLTLLSRLNYKSLGKVDTGHTVKRLPAHWARGHGGRALGTRHHMAARNEGRVKFGFEADLAELRLRQVARLG